MSSISLIGSTNGSGILNTTVNIPLPSYENGDYILLIVNRNNANVGEFIYSSEINNATEIAEAGTRRLTAVCIEPNGANQTSFSITGSNSYWSYWCGVYRGADIQAAVLSKANTIGNSTSSLVEIPTISLDYEATGNEISVSASGVNSTATFTPDENTVFNTTSGEAALMINSQNLNAGDLSIAFNDMDRGLSGDNRNENSLSLVIQGLPNGIKNLLKNASFEEGATIATNWTDESTATGSVVYSLSSLGTTDGAKAQRVQYTGVAGDDGTKKVQFYQAPIYGVSLNNRVELSIDISGYMINSYMLIGLEAFDSSYTYISDTTKTITSVNPTPSRETVSYTIPAGSSYIAAFVQMLEVNASTSIDLYFDKALLKIVNFKPSVIIF